MSSRKSTAQQKNSHNKIEGLTYEPWGMPTERVLRLNAEYAKKEAENSSRKEIIRHLITPAELLHRPQKNNPRPNCDCRQADIYKYSRQRMVKEQLAARGITDQAVLRAMETVPRHLFVNEALHPTAYDDRPLPIACGQTISQPYTVALMCQLLMAERGMKVLEIGTGSGYQAGLELFAPFDRIIVAAGGPTVPDALKNQLAENGIMLIPVGSERMSQNLIRVFKLGNVCKEENHGTTTFVDLVGKQGW